MLSRIEPKIHFPFSLKKGVAMLQYLLQQVGGEYTYMGLLKLAFFADRYHVRKYARPISMDEYYAFPYGPGGSMLKDILLEPEVIFFQQENPIERSSAYNVRLVSQNIDLKQFSKADIDALSFSTNNFADIGKRPKGEFILSDISHAYPEWDQYADLFNSGKTKRESICYEDFLSEPKENHPMFLKHRFIDPFDKLTEEERTDLIDEMREYSAVLSS
ncbi:MAG: Panacea domain-containing protein [Bacteroidota bacterium]|jgi:hypothetical protein